MRSITGDVRVERPFPFDRLQPSGCLAEKDVRAIAGRLLELAVVQNRRIEISVARRITATAHIALTDAARAMDEDFIEPAPVGLIFGLVAQVPFAENASGVTGVFEHLRQGGG